LLCLVLVPLAPVRTAGAQGAMGSQSTHHAAVCAAGVRTYTSLQEVPTVHDTLPLPPSPRVQVTNDEEAAAADLAMRGRAGSVGATGVVITDVTENSDGGMVLHRHVVPVFVPSDSARAHAACKT